MSDKSGTHTKELHRSSRHPANNQARPAAEEQGANGQQTVTANSPVSALTEALIKLGHIPGKKIPPSVVSKECKQEKPKVSDKGSKDNSSKEYFLYYKGMKF